MLDSIWLVPPQGPVWLIRLGAEKCLFVKVIIFIDKSFLWYELRNLSRLSILIQIWIEEGEWVIGTRCCFAQKHIKITRAGFENWKVSDRGWKSREGNSFSPLSSCFLCAPSSTREPVHRLFDPLPSLRPHSILVYLSTQATFSPFWETR